MLMQDTCCSRRVLGLATSGDRGAPERGGTPDLHRTRHTRSRSGRSESRLAGGRASDPRAPVVQGGDPRAPKGPSWFATLSLSLSVLSLCLCLYKARDVHVRKGLRAGEVLPKLFDGDLAVPVPVHLRKRKVNLLVAHVAVAAAALVQVLEQQAHLRPSVRAP